MNPDAQAIMTASLASADQTYMTVAFAVATANCPFMQSINTMYVLKKWGADVEFKVYAEITIEEKSMMGCGLTANKLAYYKELYRNRYEIHAKYLECYGMDNGHLVFWEYCMDCLQGMAFIKAAFATQMLWGASDESGIFCVDVHNANRLGIKLPTGAKKSKNKRAQYLNICVLSGWTSSFAWQSWCDFLANKYPGQFTDGMQVSRMHSQAVIL